MSTVPRPPSLEERLRRLSLSFWEWIWARPDNQEPAWQQLARAGVRILVIFVQEFHRDRITLRASALTFTIILSLVPTLALGTAVLKGLGAGDQAREAAYRLLDQLELSASSSTPQGETRSTPAPGTMTAHLRRAVDQIFDYVDRTDFATLGTFGVIGLVLAVISVLGSIEKSMNAIWQAASSRPLGRKVMDYLALMILLPLAINLTLATEATLQSEALRSRVQHLLPGTAIEHLLLSLMPLAFLIATFTVLYRFLPNTRVKVVPALVGGLFGGLLWLVAQSLYIRLQIGVARYNAIYGSFATLPLFLLWMQMGWIIFLSGAEMAFATQNWRHYRLERQQPSPVASLALAFGILTAVHVDFGRRLPSSLASLAERLQAPETVVQPVVDRLCQAGMLRQVMDDETGYLPGLPLETLDLAEVVDLILGRKVPPGPGARLAEEALAGARKALQGKKLTREV